MAPAVPKRFEEGGPGGFGASLRRGVAEELDAARRIVEAELGALQGALEEELEQHCKQTEAERGQLRGLLHEAQRQNSDLRAELELVREEMRSTREQHRSELAVGHGEAEDLCRQLREELGHECERLRSQAEAARTEAEELRRQLQDEFSRERELHHPQAAKCAVAEEQNQRVQEEPSPERKLHRGEVAKCADAVEMERRLQEDLQDMSKIREQERKAHNVLAKELSRRCEDLARERSKADQRSMATEELRQRLLKEAKLQRDKNAQLWKQNMELQQKVGELGVQNDQLKADFHELAVQRDAARDPGELPASAAADVTVADAVGGTGGVRGMHVAAAWRAGSAARSERGVVRSSRPGGPGVRRQGRRQTKTEEVVAAEPLASLQTQGQKAMARTGSPARMPTAAKAGCTEGGDAEGEEGERRSKERCHDSGSPLQTLLEARIADAHLELTAAGLAHLTSEPEAEEPPTTTPSWLMFAEEGQHCRHLSQEQGQQKTQKEKQLEKAQDHLLCPEGSADQNGDTKVSEPVEPREDRAHCSEDHLPMEHHAPHRESTVCDDVAQKVKGMASRASRSLEPACRRSTVVNLNCAQRKEELFREDLEMIRGGYWLWRVKCLDGFDPALISSEGLNLYTKGKETLLGMSLGMVFVGREIDSSWVEVKGEGRTFSMNQDLALSHGVELEFIKDPSELITSLVLSNVAMFEAPFNEECTAALAALTTKDGSSPHMVKPPDSEKCFWRVLLENMWVRTERSDKDVSELPYVRTAYKDDVFFGRDLGDGWVEVDSNEGRFFMRSESFGGENVSRREYMEPVKDLMSVLSGLPAAAWKKRPLPPLPPLLLECPQVPTIDAAKRMAVDALLDLGYPNTSLNKVRVKDRSDRSRYYQTFEVELSSSDSTPKFILRCEKLRRNVQALFRRLTSEQQEQAAKAFFDHGLGPKFLKAGPGWYLEAFIRGCDCKSWTEKSGKPFDLKKLAQLLARVHDIPLEDIRFDWLARLYRYLWPSWMGKVGAASHVWVHVHDLEAFRFRNPDMLREWANSDIGHPTSAAGRAIVTSHGDFHEGNIMITDTNDLVTIDLERACPAFAVHDLRTICSRLIRKNMDDVFTFLREYLMARGYGDSLRNVEELLLDCQIYDMYEKWWHSDPNIKDIVKIVRGRASPQARELQRVLMGQGLRGALSWWQVHAPSTPKIRTQSLPTVPAGGSGSQRRAVATGPVSTAISTGDRKRYSTSVRRQEACGQEALVQSSHPHAVAVVDRAVLDSPVPSSCNGHDVSQGVCGHGPNRNPCTAVAADSPAADLPEVGSGGGRNVQHGAQANIQNRSFSTVLVADPTTAECPSAGSCDRPDEQQGEEALAQSSHPCAVAVVDLPTAYPPAGDPPAAGSGSGYDARPSPPLAVQAHAQGSHPNVILAADPPAAGLPVACGCAGHGVRHGAEIAAKARAQSSRARLADLPMADSPAAVSGSGSHVRRGAQARAQSSRSHAAVAADPSAAKLGSWFVNWTPASTMSADARQALTRQLFGTGSKGMLTMEAFRNLALRGEDGLRMLKFSWPRLLRAMSRMGEIANQPHVQEVLIAASSKDYSMTSHSVLESGKTLWLVVGVRCVGGLWVRRGFERDSARFPDRLSMGSVVEEAERVGDRLRFHLLRGEGPEQGWVTTGSRLRPYCVSLPPLARCELAV